jgi:predicted permease
MASVDLGLQRYTDERGKRFLDELLPRVEALPGVRSATIASHVPFDFGIMFTDVAIEGEIPGSKDSVLAIAFSAVGPTFFETAQVSLMRGRGFTREDHERSRRVAVVNAAMAQKLWPGKDAVGQRLRLGAKGPWIEVVGVARDGKYMMLAEPRRAYFYIPIAQDYRSPVTILVRTASDPAHLAGPLQAAVNAQDPDLPVFNIRTMTDHMRDSVFAFMPFRAAVWMAGVQGVVGLLLAVMGLYAVVSYTVATRTREIGVRMALGARGIDVLRLVVRDGMRLTAIGIAIGLLIAIGIGFVLSRVLFGLTAVDGAVLVGVTTLLTAIAALACYAPARRATHLDPMVALRRE